MPNKKNILSPHKLYINSLIDNLNKNSIPKNMDLILDGGAFNGGYQIGILLYLKELENLKLTNINKISGCSVGALLGTMYIGNYLEGGINYYETILNYYRCNSNLCKLSSLITEFVNKYIDDVSIFNDKLYINYYDLINVKQVIISTYLTKDDLIDALIKSSYIPYIIDGNNSYNGCCDGFAPFIFPKIDNLILYINLQPIYRINKMLYIKNEENIWPRLLIGMVDANNFFAGVNSEFCSYTKDWSLKTTSMFRIKELFILLIVLVLNSIQCILDKIPNNIKQNIYVLRIQTILKLLYKDVFRYIFL